MARAKFTPEISDQRRKDIIAYMLFVEKDHPNFSSILYCQVRRFSLTSLRYNFSSFNGAKIAAGLSVSRPGRHRKGGNKHREIGLIKYTPTKRFCNRCDNQFDSWDKRKNYTCNRCLRSERTDFDDLS